MAKLVIDTETGLIQAEMPPSPDAPLFAADKPQVFTGELTLDNTQEAVKWIMEQYELEEMQSEEKQEAA